MSVPRCRTCKRWQPNDSGVLLNWGTCRVFRDLPGVSVETDDDGQGAAVTVDTLETFGCVEHQERGE